MSDEQPYAREHGSETDDVIHRPDGSTIKRRDPSESSTAEPPAQHPESGVAGTEDNQAGDPPADETADAVDGAPDA